MATNIKVTLEADISKYQQGLKDATAAADKFTQSVSKGTAGAEAGFTKVAASANAVTSAMSKIAAAADTAAMRANSLVTALGGLAAGAFINSLLQGASASKDMSEAFGLSIESVLELQAAFGAAGRGPEKLNQALATLSDTAVGALQGNYALRDSFAKLGISMADLQNKSAKEIIQQVATTMTSGNVSASQLAATYDILGRSAKGLPWGDLKDKLDKVNGTMGPAAQATEQFDAVLKKMEATASAVKKEFIILAAPVAEFLNTLSTNGNGAKLMAEGIAAAMAVMAGAAIVNGLNTIGTAIKGLVGWFTGLFAATTAETGAVVANTAAFVTNASAIAAGAAARVQSITASIASARATLADAEAMQAGVAAAAELAAARRVLVFETRALAVAQGQLAEATAIANGALTGAGAQAAKSAGMFGAIGTAVASAAAFLGLPIWATIGAILAGIAAAASALLIVWKAFGPEIKALGSMVGDWLIDKFQAFVGLIDDAAAGLRRLFGLKPNPELTKSLETNAEYLKRLGVTPSNQQGRGNAGMPQAVAGEGVSVVTQGVTGNLQTEGDRAVAAGTAALNPMAAQEEGLRRQLELLKLQNDQQEAKLKLQLQLVGAGEEAKAQAMAELDFKQKQTQEVFRLETEIAKLQQQAGNEQGGAGKYGGQIELLKKQRDYIKQQVDDTSALTASIVAANQAEQMRVFYIEQQTKAKNQLKDLERSIADFNKSEDDRRIGAIQNMIALEQDAAVKKRQDQLGNKPIGDQERLDIMQKIASTYDPLIAKQREYNAALAQSEATKFVLDLQNKAIENQISLTSEVAKLTQTADQQRITDLNTQLELMARQEIVRRQSKLAPGQSIGADEQAAIRREILAANQTVISSTEELIAKGREFSTGWEQAFNQYKSDSYNAANEAKTYFDTFTKGFEDAFVKMVQTGKFSFKDLANTMIAEFARIQARKLASGILDFDFKGSMSGGGLFGGGGGGGFFGNILGSIGSIFGFASGGNPAIGKPMIVGENGPELMIPRNASTIVPNEAIGGGNQTTVNYNIQAVDAASFQQLVARDPKFLHAVVEKGRRSLPQGARR